MAQIIFALAAVNFSVLPVSAQQNTDSRYLFIFDTSSAMKWRLPAVDTQIDMLLSSSMSGQMQPDDSIGVWFFNEELHRGELPLQKWSPDRAVTLATDLKSFLAKQSFSGSTRFSVLQPYLNDVVQHSERLTILIFSDGDGQFTGSPYDADINAVFKQKMAAQKKLKQPLVLVLRSQLGQFIGANVGLPPGVVGLPGFPPLPPPPTPTNPPPVLKIPTPAPVAPPLIIIGTNVSTNLPPASASSPIKLIIKEKPSPPMVTNIVNITNITNVIVVKTNPPPAAPAVVTNNAVVTKTASASQPTNSIVQSNDVAAPVKMDSTSKSLVIGGAILLVVAGGLTMFLVGRSRGRDRASLITRSLNKK